MGVGAGAVGFLKERRYYPTTDIELYIKEPLNIHEEPLTTDELLTEQLFLGLRSNIGVHQDILDEEMQKRADFLVEKDKLLYSENRYFNPNYFIADELVLYILD